MKSATLPVDISPSEPLVTRRSTPALISDLVKARLNFFNLVTAMAGFCMGSSDKPIDYILFLNCILGTALSAAGAAALNQVIERDADAKMRRTQFRPLPSGEMTTPTATAIGIGSCLVGLWVLWSQVNHLAAWVSLATIVSYVLFYTPLKKASSLNTLVGAIPGALPPVIGYAASANRLDSTAASLFAILFLWQLPHFLAISWLYREDYLKGGFVMISGRDPSGRETSWKALGYTLLLIASTFLPFYFGTNNLVWLAGSLALGLAFFVYAARFVKTRSAARARQLFFASIIYLPILLGLLVFTRR